MYAEFIDKEVEDYTEHHSDQEPALLQELNRETNLKVLKPRMLAGSYQGRLLSIISKIKSPKYILEIGTYTGYSALCWLEGLQRDGELHTIDNNEELERMVQRYFSQADHDKRIHHHLGNALNVIPKINRPWDIVFLDADKENYLNYYKLLIDDLAPGALIVADNVLWSGKVLDASAKDKDTVSLRAFNEYIRKDSRVSKVMLPVRDGITLIVKN